MRDYEIRVAGRIGPAAASRLPDFTSTAVPVTTILNGMMTDLDVLHRVLDLLTAHGLTPIEIVFDG